MASCLWPIRVMENVVDLLDVIRLGPVPFYFTRMPLACRLLCLLRSALSHLMWNKVAFNPVTFSLGACTYLAVLASGV